MCFVGQLMFRQPPGQIGIMIILRGTDMAGFNKYKKIIAVMLVASFFLVYWPFVDTAYAAPEDNSSTSGTTSSTEEAAAQGEAKPSEQDVNVKSYTVTPDNVPAFKPFEGMSTLVNRPRITTPEKSYVLTVATGATSGENVLYFAVKYTDKSGTLKSQYIFPGIDAAKRSDDFLTYYARKNASVDDISTTFGKSALAPLHYTVEKSDVEKLGAWTVQDFAFQTDEEIGEVKSIDVYLQKGQWSVQGIAIYKMEEFKGYEEYGLVSGDRFLDFKGYKIAELIKKNQGVLTLDSGINDTVQNIGGAYSEEFDIATYSDKPNEGDQATEADRSRIRDYAINNSVYTFRVDLSDVDGAGIKAFRNYAGEKISGNMGIVEDMTLEFQYRDINGWTRKVTLPVILSSYIMAMRSVPFNAIYGFAQKGETLAFQGFLPEFSTVVSSATIRVGKAAKKTIEAKGIKTSDETAKMKENLDSVASANLRISGISLYKGGCMAFIRGGRDSNGVSLEGASLEYLIQNGDSGPLFYYTTTDTGQLLTPGEKDSTNLGLREYKTGSQVIASKALNDLFLVTLYTSDKPNAGTKGDVTVKFTYRDQDGDEAHTQTYSVKTSAEAYLGPWPSTSGGSYISEYGLTQGSAISFLIEARNLQEFTSAEVKHSGDDFWEMKNLTISYVETMSARKAYMAPPSVIGTKYWLTRQLVSAEIFNLLKTASTVFNEKGNIVGGDGKSSDSKEQMKDEENHLIYDSEGKPVYVGDDTSSGGYRMTGGQLFIGDQGYTIDFGKGIAFEAKDQDYNAVRYKMTYDQTQVDWGFFKKRKTYNVAVKVAKDSEVDTGNGDAGSKNYFYFQLAFQNGRSAFVQANQQLAGDAFRSGNTEIFSISTNRDYGEISAINIIPEDLASDSTPFDKLNIDSITVSEQTSGGTNISYVFDKIGWIDIDYRDDAERSSMRGLRPRTSMELVKSYNKPYRERSVKLLCEVSMLPWEGEYNQFQGSVWGRVDYVKASDNTLDHIDFDVVQYIAAYQNKAAVSMEAASNPALQTVPSGGQGTISDPETMFRANKTDRFIMPAISDLKSIKSISFIPQTKNNEGAYFNIGKVTMSQILEDGPVQLTENGELYRNLTTKKLAMNKESKVYSKYLMMGKAETIGPIPFTDNEIVWSAESWATPVARIPDSTEDVVNIFVYPYVSGGNAQNFYDTLEESPELNERSAVVNANLVYNIPYSQQMSAACDLVAGRDGKGHNLYYALNVKAENFVSAVKLSLHCADTTQYFNHAIVQHVREGVVISTYTFNFMDSTAVTKLSANTFGINNYLDKTEESLFISFGSGTAEMNLQSVNNDIAVSINYLSSIGGESQEYSSPFVYLTDQNINSIREGLMAEIKFDIPYVRVITGYRIAGYGSVKASVNSSAAIVYKVIPGETDMTGAQAPGVKKRRTYTSFLGNFDITDRVLPYRATSYSMYGENSVAPVSLAFTSTDSAKAGDGTKDAAVRASLTYEDFTNQSRQIRYPDLRKYIQGDTRAFQAGTTANVQLFIPEMSADMGIQYLDLLPYDPDVEIPVPGASDPVSGADYSVDTLVRDMREGVGIFAEGTASQALQTALLSARSASWTVSKIDYNAGFANEPVPKQIDQTFQGIENGGRVRMNNVTFSTYVALNNSGTRQVMNRSMQLLAKGDDVITGTVTLKSTTAGFTVKASRMVGEAGEDVTADTIQIFDATRSFQFKVPKNLSGGLIVYKIDVSPVEAQDLVDSIYVSVENEAITISTNVSVNGAADIPLTDHHGMVTVKPGAVIKVKVKVENSTAGINVGAYKMGDPDDENVTNSTVSYLTVAGFDFTVPNDEGGVKYRIEISPLENYDLKDTLYVVVDKIEEETEDTTDQGTDSTETPTKEPETPSSEGQVTPSSGDPSTPPSENPSTPSSESTATPETDNTGTPAPDNTSNPSTDNTDSGNGTVPAIKPGESSDNP